MHQLIVIGSFCFLGIILTLFFFYLLEKGINPFGKSSKHQLLVYIGKTALFSCWFLAAFQAANIKWIHIPNLEQLQWSGTIFILIGVFLMIVSFINLGLSLRMGLPNEDTKLKTSGLYRISRNPIYLGFISTSIGSILYFPAWYAILCAIIATVIHHFIIKEEEAFLEKRFGQAWENYRTKVARYL